MFINTVTGCSDRWLYRVMYVASSPGHSHVFNVGDDVCMSQSEKSLQYSL